MDETICTRYTRSDALNRTCIIHTRYTQPYTLVPIKGAPNRTTRTYKVLSNSGGEGDGGEGSGRQWRRGRLPSVYTQSQARSHLQTMSRPRSCAYAIAHSHTPTHSSIHAMYTKTHHFTTQPNTFTTKPTTLPLKPTTFTTRTDHFTTQPTTLSLNRTLLPLNRRTCVRR